MNALNMEIFQDYTLVDLIDETRGALVYKGFETENQNPVIVKILKTATPSAAAVAKVKNEYQIIRTIRHKGLVPVLGMVEDNGRLAVVSGDINGQSIESCIEKQPFALKDFLKAGIEISDTLSEIHHNEIFHGEISPAHLYIDQKTGDVRITDFGVNSLLTRKYDELYNEDVIRESLCYISPEQTGRMNRWVDYRTDMYSLGVLFYQMLTGQVPFFSNDPMEVIYSHLAVSPAPPSKLNPKIPKMVSDIVLKLLSKNAEDRYQNASGLCQDLKKCLAALDRHNKISKFSLGKNDIPRRFLIPQKLYGRSEQIKTLLNAFEQACSGETRVFMVAGAPGIGKSALVNEIHKPIVAKRGFFVTGKYEQYRKDVPYSSIIQAFQSLVRQILSQSDYEIILWKDRLEAALGQNAKVITDVIGDVELIMGPQPDVPVLGPEETRNRFNLMFERFVGVFSGANYPLVLFLDDLQWADLASLDILNTIICGDIVSHLMVVGAYRDNEVDSDHALPAILSEIAASGVQVESISVQPLTGNQVTRMINDHLKGAETKASVLSDIVIKKTGGNPFFVNQFLKTLYDERMIWLDAKTGWAWDVAKISDMQVTDNLVELLVEKINKLKPDTREILKICSCIGNRFDLEVIAHLQEKTVENVLASLREAILEGLIDGTDHLYFYHHDRIQEAAYSLLNPEEKSFIHYRVGKKVVEEANGGALNGKLFYVADQLNAGVKWVSENKETALLAQFNFEAGKKAKASGAYTTALEYFQNGLKNLDKDAWDKSYELALNLHLEISEIQYLTGDMDLFEQTVKTAIKNVTSGLDESRFTSVRVKAYKSHNQFDKALKTGLGMLGKLGIDVPMKPDDTALFEVFGAVAVLLDGKDDQALLALPEIEDENMLAASQLMLDMSNVAYLVSRELSGFLCLKMVHIHLEYGLHPLAGSAFVMYGALLTSGVGDINSGVRFGKLAFRILEKYNNQSLLAQVLSTYNLLIRHWVEPPENSAAAGLEVHRIGMETGQLDSAAMGLFLHDTYSIASGENFVEIEKSMKKHNRWILKLNQHHIAVYHSMWIRMVQNYIGKTSEDPTKLELDGLNAEQMANAYLEKHDYSALCNLYQIQFFLNFYFGKHEEALGYLEKSEAYQDHIRGLINSNTLVYYGAVARLSIWHLVDEARQKQFMAVVDANLMQLQHWMNISPRNFAYQCKLVEAMKAQVAGDLMLAMDLFDEAISLCNENGNISEISLITAIAGNFFERVGKERLAKLYLTETFQSHLASGKKALVEYYRNKYPFLEKVIETSIGLADRQEHQTKLLAIKSVVDASQTLSGEIVMDRLLNKMMQIVLQSAGAQKGYMIIKEEDALYVQAECLAQDEEIKLLKSTRISEHDGFSRALVNTVARTMKTIILNDASGEGDFVQDPYFRRHKSKSVLCQAVVRQGRLAGVLYLENNLATGVFTSNHLEILEIIAAQVAISIENTRLYENLEQKVKERTRELEEAYEKIKVLANTDPLTQLSNRRDMLEKIGYERKRMERNKTASAVLLCDIDDFKSVNDTYGHDCGDYVLKTVAGILRSTVRKQDLVARWGGEEFLLLLPDTDLKGGQIIAEKIRKAVNKKAYAFNNYKFSLSLTFGVSSFNDPHEEIDKYLKQADDALYKGKETGKNRVILFSG